MAGITSHQRNDWPYRNKHTRPNLYPLAGDDRPLTLLKRGCANSVVGLELADPETWHRMSSRKCISVAFQNTCWTFYLTFWGHFSGGSEMAFSDFQNGSFFTSSWSFLLLTVDLLHLQSVEVLIRRTFPL